MATWEEVREIARDLPELEESPGRLEWRVRGKAVIWNRPLRKSDLEALGNTAPPGTIAGVRVADVAEQQALVQNGPESVFITPHFHGWPAVLVELDRISPEDLEELIVDGWLTQAPKRLARAWLEDTGREAG